MNRQNTLNKTGSGSDCIGGSASAARETLMPVLESRFWIGIAEAPPDRALSHEKGTRITSSWRVTQSLAFTLCLAGWSVVSAWAGNSIGTATPISLGSSVSGSINYPGDESYFQVSVNSAGTLTAYTTGSTDTYGYLLDSYGTTLTSNDDNPYPNFNLSYPVSPGTYYIRVRHYSSSGTGNYTLCTVFNSSGGTSGGDDHGNTMSSATSISLGGSVSGNIDYGGDEDYFRVSVGSQGTLSAYTTGSTDTYGYLLDANGTTLTSSDDNPYPNFNFSYSVNPGTFYIRVRHYSISGTGSYTLYTSFSSGGGGSGGGGGVTLGEALDNTSLSWTTGGNGSWYGQTGVSYSGGDAAQSVWINNSESTYLATTVTGPGTLSFFWRVSSEYGYDFLRFYLDGLEQTRISGEVGWSSLSFNLSSGSHTLQWTYSTDGSVLTGSNAGWVDCVQFTPPNPPSPPPANTPDIIWRHRTIGLNAIWFMSGTSLQQSAPILPDLLPDLNWNIVGAGDFNNDGQQDLVWQHRTTGIIGIWFMNGRAMQSTALTNPERASDLNWRIAGVGDFNRDGKPDLLWQHDATRQIAIWYMDGVNLSSSVLTTPSVADDSNWRIMGVGDFNSDGWPDLLWEHQLWGQVAVWFMNGASLVYGTLTYPSAVDDLNWKITGTGDFTGDNRTDITWQHAGTGMISVWHMNGASWLYPTVFTPAYPDSADWRAQAVANIQTLAVDADNDLMPDAWEMQYFGTLDQTANGDYDGDGISNAQEYRNGTNPTVPAPTIKIAWPRSGTNVP